VARPREFEYNEVLDRALQVFWSFGYKRTSMEKMVSKLKVNRASMYNTYGCKERLFHSALERYVKTQLPSIIHRLRAPNKSAEAQLYSCFCAMIKLGGKDNAYRGCFVINSLNELSLSEPELSNFCANALNVLTGEMHQVVIRGQHQGEFRSDVDSKVLTTHLLSTVCGLMALAKIKIPMSHLKATVKTGLRFIAPEARLRDDLV
jgi:TetR/AcrR family transcriptional repressor of nem operon